MGRGPTRERGRPARMRCRCVPLGFAAMPGRPPHGGNDMGSANAEPMRHCRSIRVEVMGEAAGGFVRAGRPRSRVDFIETGR